MSLLRLALVAAICLGCATVQRRGEQAAAEWDGSGGGLWVPPSGLFLNQAQQNAGNDLSINNLVVNGTTRFNGTVTAAANIVPSASNTFNLGLSGGTWASIFLSAGIRDSASVVRYGISSSVSANTYRGSVANSSTNDVHIMTSTNTMSGGTGLLALHNDTAAAAYEFRVHNSGKVMEATADTTGTPGNATITTPTGQVAVAAAAASVTVTSNSDVVTTASIIYAVIQEVDATCNTVRSVVPSAGSFVITLNAACTADTNVGFVVFN